MLGLLVLIVGFSDPARVCSQYGLHLSHRLHPHEGRPLREVFCEWRRVLFEDGVYELTPDHIEGQFFNVLHQAEMANLIVDHPDTRHLMDGAFYSLDQWEMPNRILMASHAVEDGCELEAYRPTMTNGYRGDRLMLPLVLAWASAILSVHEVFHCQETDIYICTHPACACVGEEE